MTKEKILITVKTYPVISEGYAELACTAGFREDGSWIRLYPIPFRLLDQDLRYEKYQWIEADIAKSIKDARPESYRVTNVDGMSLLGKIDTGKNRDWAERRRLILSKNKIFTNKAEIIAKAHANEMSLAIFKPTKIAGFLIEKVEPEWNADKLQIVQDRLKQKNLFDEQSLADFKPVNKLPYRFKYKFLDDSGVESALMIEDWEIGALFWRYHRSHGEEEAVKKVREKYMDEIAAKRDLYLFLGTTHQWHAMKAPNPYVVVGTFHPPHITQPSLL